MKKSATALVVAVLASAPSLAACGNAHPSAPVALPGGNAGVSPGSAQVMNCNFDAMVAGAEAQAARVHSGSWMKEMTEQRHFSESQMRSIFNDVCGDKVFTHMTDVLLRTGPEAARTDIVFDTYLNECQGENPVDAFAGMFEVSLADAQGEYDKLRNHGCQI